MNKAPRIKSKSHALGAATEGKRLVLLRMETRGTPSNMGYRFRAYTHEIAAMNNCRQSVCEQVPSVYYADTETQVWEAAYVIS